MASVKKAGIRKASKAEEGKDKTEDGYWILEGGTVLTPELEERLSEEFESDDFVDNFRGRTVRVGRPPLDGVRVSERITFRIPPDLYDAAKAKADKELRSISNLAREALKRYVAE